MTQTADRPVEDVLRDELAQGDAAIGTLVPILRHLLANDGQSLFTDEIVARVRGMLADLARQLLVAVATAAEAADPHDIPEEQLEALVESFLEHSALLGHAHALALEWQLAERLHARNDADPVLSPLLQSLMASSDAGIAAGAMTTLAAQARFVQSQRRMELPLSELPGDLFHQVLVILRAQAIEGMEEATAKAEAKLRSNFDESRSRLGLISRLVTTMGGSAITALSIDHAGAAIFLSALAIGSGQDRDLAVLSTSDSHLARLALSLRAAGLKPQAVEEQFLYLHPEFALPEGFEQLRADSAAALLSYSSPYGEA